MTAVDASHEPTDTVVRAVVERDASMDRAMDMVDPALLVWDHATSLHIDGADGLTVNPVYVPTIENATRSKSHREDIHGSFAEPHDEEMFTCRAFVLTTIAPPVIPVSTPNAVISGDGTPSAPGQTDEYGYNEEDMTRVRISDEWDNVHACMTDMIDELSTVTRAMDAMFESGVSTTVRQMVTDSLDALNASRESIGETAHTKIIHRGTLTAFVTSYETALKAIEREIERLQSVGEISNIRNNLKPVKQPRSVVATR